MPKAARTEVSRGPSYPSPAAHPPTSLWRWRDSVARQGSPACSGAIRFGDFLLHNLQHAGVATDDVVRCDNANTALAFVTLDAQGERSFSFYREHSADLLFRAGDFRQARFR